MKNDFDRLYTVSIFKNIKYDAQKELHNIAQLAADICQTPAALITLLDDSDNNFITKVGVEVNSMPAETSFCQYTIEQDDIMVIPDTHLDSRFSSYPQVVAAPNVRFYAGVPLHTNSGHKIGSLCVLDVQPKILQATQRKTLEVLSRQAIILMEYELSQQLLKKHIADIDQQNEILQHISKVHSHDFRGPVASLMGMMNLIREDGYTAQKEYLLMMEDAIKELDEKIHLVVEYTQVL